MWLSATSHGIAVNKYRFIYTSALLTLAFYKTLPTRYTTNAATQAITHCPITTPTAHLLPSSLLMDAIAATHGVYKRQNTSRLAADTGVIQPSSTEVCPKRTDNVDTTLSFAMNPVISAVDILQSPNPIGANTGAITLATVARILSCESLTMFR